MEDLKWSAKVLFQKSPRDFWIKVNYNVCTKVIYLFKDENLIWILDSNVGNLFIR